MIRQQKNWIPLSEFKHGGYLILIHSLSPTRAIEINCVYNILVFHNPMRKEIYLPGENLIL